MVEGKKKGSSFENKILKQLRELDCLAAHKTLGSGNTADDKGDLVFPPYLIECKHHKRLTKNTLMKFWEKICEEAEGQGLRPLLVYKENFRETMVMTDLGYGDAVFMQFWDDFYSDLKEAYVDE